ncbi:hypothetical protein [Psychrobacillus sp. FSL K6-1464]
MYLFEEIVIKGIEQNPIIEIRGINDHPKVEYERLDIEAPFGKKISSIAQFF